MPRRCRMKPAQVFLCHQTEDTGTRQEERKTNPPGGGLWDAVWQCVCTRGLQERLFGHNRDLWTIFNPVLWKGRMSTQTILSVHHVENALSAPFLWHFSHFGFFGLQNISGVINLNNITNNTRARTLGGFIWRRGSAKMGKYAGENPCKSSK